MTTVGVLKPFDSSSDDIEIWIRTFRAFLIANAIDVTKDEARCRAILLSTLGLNVVSTLVDLISPDEPEKKGLDDLLTILTTHFKPTPKAVAERFKFMGRKQQQGESIAQFLAELRKLASTCKFSSELNTRLRDQFIFGLLSESTQRKLFTQSDDVKLDKVVSIAQAQELSEKSTSIIRNGSSSLKGEEVLKVQKKFQSQFNNNSNKYKKKVQTPQHSKNPTSTAKQNHSKPRSCPNCGSSAHTTAKDCPHKSVKCFTCQKMGHFAKMCRSKSRTYDAGVLEVNSSSVLCLDSGNKKRKLFVDVIINGHQHKMEFDTGCETSLLSHKFWKDSLSSSVPLTKSTTKFQTYTSQLFESIGEAKVELQYKDQSIVHQFPIGPGMSLFGRDLIKKLKFNWQDVIQQCNQVAPLSLNSLLNEFSDIFSHPKGKIKNFQAKIVLKDDATPKFLKARPIPYALQEKVDQELQEMEKAGVITKISHSEWASPLVVVQKANGKVRITGDFKNTVNSQLHITQYPIANPEKLFSTLSGGEKFSKMEGQNAYHQIEVEESCRKFLVINTHRGLYMYNVLPQGIASSPAIFQEFADHTFEGIPNSGSYLDDGCCTAQNDQQHLQNLKQIFTRMRESNYYISKDKCQFMQPHIEFLGHVISRHGIHTSPKKIEAIQAIQRPKDVSELRTFLGIVNFYGKFVPNLANLCSALYSLTKHDSKWEWTTECNEAFEQVKKLLSSSPTLCHFELDRPIGISCDASKKGLGVVLFHKFQQNGKTTEKPIAYASRVLTPTEQRYSQIEKEGLAIRYGLEKFYKFLCGRKFTLITDHKPLLAIFGSKQSLKPYVAARLHRWSVYMSQFQYEIQFRKTDDHGNADVLSRFPMLSPPGQEDDSKEVNLIASELINSLPVSVKSIRQATAKDKCLSKVLRFINNDWAGSTQAKDEEMSPFITRRNELTSEQGVIMWGIRAVIPSTLKKKILDNLHECHFGIVRMKSLARQHVWWPNIDHDIENVCKSCDQCCSTRNNPPSAPLHPWQYPERPWQRLHIDLAGPMYNKMYLVLMDANTKWPEVFDLNKDTTSASVIKKLREVFCRFGLPEQIVSDNGTQFTSAEFKMFCNNNGIKHTTSSVYHPRSNGEAERLVQTFKKSMANSSGDINLRLQRFLLSYRVTPHTTTGATPAELLMGRKPRTLLDLTKPDVHVTVSQSQSRQERDYNSRVKSRLFMEGEEVWIKTFSKNEAKWSLGKVVKAIGPVTYIVSINGKEMKRHIDHIFQAMKFQLSSHDQMPQAEKAPQMVSTPPQSQSSPQTPSPISFHDAEAGSSPEIVYDGPHVRPQRNPPPIRRLGYDAFK